MTQILIDGIPIEVADDRQATILQRHLEALKATTSTLALKRKLKDAKGDDDSGDSDDDVEAEKDREKKERGWNDAIAAKDGEIALLKKRLTDSQFDEAKQEAILRERDLVKDAARKVLGDGFEFGTKSLAEIRRAVVSDAMGGDKAIAAWDDAQVMGAFQLATSAVEAKKASGAKRMADGLSADLSRTEGMTRGGQKLTDADVAYDEYVKRISTDFRTPFGERRN